MAKATQKYQVKEERKSFLTANVESNLHRQITQEASRTGVSFSTHIQSIMNQNIKLQEQVDELRAEIREQNELLSKITDVN